MPLTVNGKVDRRALPDPRLHGRADSTGYEAPRTTEEEQLAQIWQEVLGLEKIGIHDPFIELGGDSILNIQIVAKAKAAGLEFTPKQLFDSRTIAHLAARVTRPGTIEQPSPVPITGDLVDGFSEAGLDDAELAELLEAFGEKE